MIRSLYISVFLLGFPGLYMPAQDTPQKEKEPIESLIHQGAYDEALELIEKALRTDSLNLSARLYKYEISRYRHKKNTSYRIARDNYKAFKDRSSGIDRIKLYLNRAEAYMIAGKTEKGFRILEEARSFLEDTEGNNMELTLYSNYIEGLFVANAYGMHDPRVERIYLNTYNQLKTIPGASPYYLSHLLHKLAIIHQTQGDFEKALDYFRQEKEVYTTHFPSGHFDIGAAYYSIGNVYYELMEYQNALDHYLPAYEVWKNHYEPKAKYMRHLTEAIGDMYWELGQKDNALPFYNLSVSGKNNQAYPKLKEVTIADSLVRGDEFEKAMNIYGDALDFRMKVYGEKHAVTGACQNQIARAHFSKGNYDEALDAYQLAMTMLIQDFNETAIHINPDTGMQVLSEKYLLEALVGKTLTLRQKFKSTQAAKDLELAFKTSQKAIEILEKLRRSPLSDHSRSYWTKRYFSLFDAAIELAYEKHGDRPAFRKIAFPIIEDSKAMLLQNALRFNKKASFLDIPEAIMERENQLKKSIREYIIRIEREELQCENAQLKKIELWNGQLLALKLEYDLFLNELKSEFPKYYHLKYHHKSLDFETIKGKVLNDDKSLVIEYFDAENFIYALAFSRNASFSFRLEKDSVFQNDLDRFITAHQSLDHALRHPEEHLEIYIDQASRLYETLLHPVLDHFPDSIGRLFIIPDKQLFYLPFETLLTTRKGFKRDFRYLPYLLRRYRLSYTQSAEVLAWSNTPGKKKNFKYSYLGFAPGQFIDKGRSLMVLNWNEQEVETARNLWEGKAFIKKAATRNHFIRHTNRSKIQHFATHAVIDNENPMLSRIVFEGDSSNLLYTYELYSLPVRSELVVLNACNTSIGKWEKGEGMISLERAFQYSGCPSLLTSIWSIDDQAAAEITTGFFEQLRSGWSKEQALNQSKLDYLQHADPAHGHPYYWAGFRIIGNTDPVSPVASRKAILGIGISLLILVSIPVLFALSNRRKRLA